MFGSTFTYNNVKYDLRVSVKNGDIGDQTILMYENIRLFQYTNELNTLNITGSIEYVDTDSRIDSLLETEFSYCEITFTRIDNVEDGVMAFDKLSKTDSISLNFFIDNYEILDNEMGKVTYRLHLISDNWLNCSRIVNYTNYNTDPQPIYEIIKTILENTENEVDSDSFGKIKSNVKLPYITGNDETVYSSIKFLMNKMYFYENTEESIKGLFYNEKLKQVCAFDINEEYGYQGCSTVEINIVKDDKSLQTEDPVNIAFQIRKQKTNVVKSTFPISLYKYSMENNSFSQINFNTEKIINYYKGKEEKCKLHSFDDSDKHLQTQTYWNNDISIYEQHFDNLTKTNGLIINMIGQIGIVPGYRIGIVVPVNYDSIGLEDTEENKKERQKYQTITGTWYVSKITNFINPHKEIFRQSISLFRNSN